MALPKWTEDRTNELTAFVGDETPISQATVAEAAEQLETSTRSISSKLRKMGFEVELASTSTARAFSESQEATLAAFVTDNSGEYTYAQIAEHFEGGEFSPKSIQGKILSMELTGHVKAAPKVETIRTYSEDEEVTFIEMVNEGAYVEAIADALDRSVNSIRGKALSLLRSGDIDAIPRQEFTKNTDKTDPLADLGDLSEMTVDTIAEAIGKTPRGVKTMLTRRGLVAADYDGAAKQQKAAQ
tara:strand:+ start:1822 stop:2547 length:726 start_codon:yes stop_codon:yes gene_type:complete